MQALDLSAGFSDFNEHRRKQKEVEKKYGEKRDTERGGR